MDKDREKILKIVSDDMNIKFIANKISDVFYHNILAVDAPNTYNAYNIRDYIMICRIDCLYDKGIITLKVKNELFELFEIYQKLSNRLGEILLSESKEDEDEKDRINEKMEHIEEIFKNYHLWDELDLKEIILKDSRVDNKDLDLEGEINKLR